MFTIFVANVAAVSCCCCYLKVGMYCLLSALSGIVNTKPGSSWGLSKCRLSDKLQPIRFYPGQQVGSGLLGPTRDYYCQPVQQTNMSDNMTI